MPEAEPLVGDLRRMATPSGSAGMGAHITVLAPFRHASCLDDGTTAILAATFSGLRAFPFGLQGVLVERGDDLLWHERHSFPLA